MRTLISVSALLLCAASLCAQVNPSITVGMTMKEVIVEMQNDDAAMFYNVKKAPNIITVSVKAGSPLNRNSIVEYFFSHNILAKIRWTNRVPNPKGMLNFIYNNHISQYGKPVKSTVEGNRAYCWQFPDQPGYHYFFIGLSDRFQKECFINVTSLNPL